ncbi:putative 33 kDa dynein arm light chain, axonemal [Neospora caninum Liverpool]|uniref:Putative 33 kDa dynein arm light chain, axonemal n=1 Tax=Neospora caninum (strain Liverpool) TaxID=572307 RepID=F0VGX6_NEOCL|nr:putative 33 kDa dynein arm light chain, axonemal [Neospora caninum Liverpool]CBZ52970.1 putative 33 kDa dynein arm light chain, axonemal [Neospora caninum Liverpool]|eukprot:XP_003883002.1 putative 33 kDa dynein arm light chain, axonemal [Neospora caninum Liverpool]
MIYDSPPRPTLVRYCLPEASPAPAAVKTHPWRNTNSTTYLDMGDGQADGGSVVRQLEKIFTESQQGSPSVDVVLNQLFPPLQWIDGDTLFTQYVSTAPADRLDVLKTQEELDEELIRRHASETGICPIRYELILQCFDELIRHIAIQGPDRALLLLRLKEEARVTIAAYEALSEACVNFSSRKQLQSEIAVGDREQRIAALEEENARLRAKVAGLQRQAAAVEAREATRLQVLRAKHQAEIEFLNQQLAFQENILLNTQNTVR